MAAHVDRWWSRLTESVESARSTIGTRTDTALSHAPVPVPQTWRLVKTTGRATIDHRITGLAAEAALYTLISLPALLLAVVGSLGFVAELAGPDGVQSLRRLVLVPPKPFLSDATYAAYEGTVATLLAQTRGGVVSLSILVSVWTGSRAVGRYLETITIAYGFEPRSIWRQRALALGLTVGGLLATIAVLPPLVAGPKLVRWLTPDAVADTTLRGLNLLFWPAIVVFLVTGLATLYHLGVPWKTPWRRDLPGAILAMVIWLVASAGLRAYLSFFVSNGGIYQQLALPIAVVLWLYITAIAVLLGAEFNAGIERLWPHERYPWRLRPLVRRLRNR
ncbi:YihY/virulence factor BrkB family protein [Mycobacterium sp. WMMD1722]|uniref:YihY/virulence factor BrkB family protein n=1 Tax=Mycobacterium sp. WMMD1722 TaxID=3404117 RepID=UPI003BF618B5